MKSGTLISILIILILVGIGGWYYFSSVSNPAPASDTSSDTGDMGDMNSASTSPTGTPTGGMETGTVNGDVSVTVDGKPEKDFTVSGFNFGFSPTTLTVKKGDHVKITFTNSGGMHDFKIDEFNVATPRLETGQTAVVEFDATKTGSFQYYCSVGNHRAMGMWGTLTVTD